MSTYEYIFIATDLEPEDVANLASGPLELRVVRDADGNVVMGRPASEGRPGRVGGEVGRNVYAYPFDDPEEESVIDGYKIVWTIRYTERTYDIQLAEARKLFTEMTDKAPWPILLVHGLDVVVAAWHPQLGLREFPPGTSVGREHRSRWEPYRQRDH